MSSTLLYYIISFIGIFIPYIIGKTINIQASKTTYSFPAQSKRITENTLTVDEITESTIKKLKEGYSVSDEEQNFIINS